MNTRLTAKQKADIAIRTLISRHVIRPTDDEYDVTDANAEMLASKLETDAHRLFDQDDQMDLPENLNLPLFVYGALKPGMPAYEGLRDFLEHPPTRSELVGELFVRDGLPLLFLNNASRVHGFLLQWRPGNEQEAYRAVCSFEPRKHYQWKVVDLEGGRKANTLSVLNVNKGNPQPLHQHEWKLSDDPAFGEGLATVREVIGEIGAKPEWNDWQRFFRAQMAYLLLWSILERLSALCFGAGHDPMKRVKRLHELRGMSELLSEFVKREDSVSDSRNPEDTYKLNKENAKKCFEYYYQVRSNLSHRGKAMYNEVEKVTKSLSELFSITEAYLKSLCELESAQ